MGENKTNRGFTIVELLIVVVVIAILAAITIVAYNGIQNQARQSAAAQTLSQAQKKISSWKVDNNEQLPATLSQVTGLVTDEDWQYIRYNSNTQFCVSTLINNIPYYSSSTQSNSFQQGRCDDIGTIQGAGAPLGFATQASPIINLSTPIVGTGDITLYAVFNIINTDNAWTNVAEFRANSGSNRIQLDNSSAGTSVMRYRIDTPVSQNVSATKGGARTPGRHIGWVRISDNGAQIQFNYDGAVAHHTMALTPGAGWNFTQVAIGAIDASTESLAAIAYGAAHDEQTRARVMQWLAMTYSVPGTY